MKYLESACLALAISLCALNSSHAQTTAFTYQGRLNSGGSPANGVFDFTFQVFNASSGGASLGGTVNVNAVGVNNGLFTAVVDLGAAPFTGPARWLQISVSTNGAGSFTTLSPRQPLTPAPYAIFANTAGTVTNGGIANSQLAANAVAGGNIQNNAVTAGKIASGQVVKSLNGLTDAVSLTQGANVTINTVGNSLQISAPSGGLTLPYSGSVSSAGPAFTLANSGAGPAAVFTGRMGIGNTTPDELLHVGAAGVRGVVRIQSGIPAGPPLLQLNDTAAGGATWNVYSGGAAIGSFSVSDGTHRLVINQSGDVGIGTVSPSARLDVVGPGGNYGQLGTANFGVYGYGVADRYGVGADSDGATGQAMRGRHSGTGNLGVIGSATQGVYGQGYGSSSDGVFGTHSPSGNFGAVATPTAGTVGVHGATGNRGDLGRDIYGVLGQCFQAVQNNAAVQGDNFVTGVHGSLARYMNNPRVYGPIDPRNTVSVGVYGSDDSVNQDNYAGLFEGQVLIRSSSRFYGAPLIVSRSDGSDGALVDFPVGDDFSGGIDYFSSFVTYSAFTGSHLAWTDEPLQQGELVRMNGTNRWAKTNRTGETIYGVTRSTTANDPGCLGSYLARHHSNKTGGARTNQHLIMAVGNGAMWVTDRGNGDLQPGQFLISSDVPGCAMKDDAERFPIGYICARAGEGVAWSEVTPDPQGIRRKKISVLYESFERHSGSPALAAKVKAQQVELDTLKAEVRSLRTVADRLARIESALAAPAQMALQERGAR